MLKAKIIDAKAHTFYEKVLSPKSEGLNECLIGRHASCDLVLNSPEISRVHCRILFWRRQCYFADLGSTDGSRLNNEEVQINRHYRLKPEDTIRLGNFILLVEAIDSQATEPSNSNQPSAAAAPAIPVWTKGDLTVRCVQIIDETHDVKTFRFVAEPAVLFQYEPGQFVMLNLEIDGQSVRRSYSISSSPAHPHTLDITVKRAAAPPDSEAAPGLVSSWLHDYLKVGMQLKLNGPLGKFTCKNAVTDTGVNKLLFLSAGSGITPMMSMAHWLCDTAAAADIIFFHSARSARDIIFQQRLQGLAAQHPNFKLAITTTRPTIGQPWFGYSGHLNSAMLQTIAPDFQERLVYVCGPHSFMDATKLLLTDLDFPMQHYCAESFGPALKPKSKQSEPAMVPIEFVDLKDEAITQPKLEAVEIDNSPQMQLHLVADRSMVAPSTTASSPSILFAKFGKEVICDAEDCILDVAEQENIDIPSGCRMGVCGACKCRVIDGEVKYAEDPAALQDAERQQGLVLSCIAQPIGRVVLEA